MSFDFNHLHLGVRDLEVSRKFYADIFGFRHKINHGDIAFMTNDDGFDLALAPGHEMAQFPSWFHYGSRLKSANEVRAVFENMQARYPELITKPLQEYDDFVFFRCTDPDGYSIEVYWE